MSTTVMMRFILLIPPLGRTHPVYPLNQVRRHLQTRSDSGGAVVAGVKTRSGASSNSFEADASDLYIPITDIHGVVINPHSGHEIGK